MKTRILFAALLLLTPQMAFAWGKVGHAVVADIAESRLTPEAKKQVIQLLAVEHNKHLSDISSWADEVKSEHLPGAAAHSIRLPLDHNDTIDMMLCPSHYCVIQGINDSYKRLSDKSLPLSEREEALKFLVHLVGDIHQPLHASKATGGNVMVMIGGKKTNLHGVWDDEIILHYSRDPEALAEKLEAAIPKNKIEFGGDASSWALESRNISRDVIYKNISPDSPGTVTMTDNDLEKMWPIVAGRLVQAGVRLGDLLNSALK